MRAVGLFLAVAIAAVALFAGAASAGEGPTVFVSVLPQQTFVERVGGDAVTVHVLVGPGRSPATYEPTPSQMAALSHAAAFFRVGVPFETNIVPRLAGMYPKLKIVDTRQGVATIASADHEHGHDHGDADPHIWLDPRRVKIQAKTIADALCELDPERAETYRRNLAAFHADLDAVDARLRAVLAPYRGRTFLVFHPAYGYFADAYGLRQLAVQVEGKSPSARQVARWIETARRERVKIVFVQPQFAEDAARAIAKAVDGAVVPLDPLAADYLANLDNMARRVAEALAQPEVVR